MTNTVESYVTEDGRTIGGVVFDMRGITLRFGGVEAIKNISFDKIIDAECDIRFLCAAGR